MIKPQIFVIEGKQFAAIPLKVYETLVEDAETLADIQDYESAKALNEECFPFELVEKRLNGENSVKVFRKYRKLTQDELAKKTKLSRAYIAEIESGRKQGSISAFKAIAAALDVDIDSLV